MAFPTRKLISAVTLLTLMLLGGLVLIFKLVIPVIVERQAVGLLEDNHVRVDCLKVDRVGLQEMNIRRGALAYSELPLTWEAIDVHYSLMDLAALKVSRVWMDSPSVELDLGPLLLSLSKERDTPGLPESAAGHGAIHSEATGLEVIPSEDGAAPLESPSTRLERSAGKAIADEVAGSGVPDPWDAASLFERLENLPVSHLQIHEGRIAVHGPDSAGLSLSIEGDLMQANGLVSGEVTFSGDAVDGDILVDGMKASRFLSIRSGMRVMPARIAPFLASLVDSVLVDVEAPIISYPDDLSIDVLLETVPGGAMAASMEANAGTTTVLFPQQDATLQVDSIQVAGTIGPKHALLGAGIRLGRTRFQGLEAEPFGIALTLDQSGLVSFESETILSRHGDWSAESAFRGRAQLSRDGSADSLRMEWSIANTLGMGVQIEDFSALLEHRDRTVRLQLSPVGLRQNGTLWLEKCQLVWDLPGESGDLGFEWYNTSGALAGSVAGTFSSMEDKGQVVDLTFSDPGGAALLNARLEANTEVQNLQVDGRLPIAWIQTLSAWWGSPLPGTLRGDGVRLQVSLSGVSPAFSGSIDMGLAECSLDTDTGLSLEGIQTDAHLEMNVFPRTLESQLITVRSIRFGDFLLEDCQLEWDLPYLYKMRVKRLEAKLGAGRVWIEPFGFNPLNPEIQTRVRFAGVGANRIMELLKEKRFLIEGTLSGSLEVGWMKGDLLLGEGAFSIDQVSTENRFRFLDPAFVDQHLSSLGDAPADVKERFREALINEGIRLDQLDVTFRSLPETSQVMLRLELSGETRTELLEFPIGGIVIKNLISEADLAEFLNMLGAVRMMKTP